ncbi:1-phosphofructokinase family hexose kinase [Fibrella sp. WM1]|uniref:1-phosphofructokinase family hexose kinase n=1 Tax=Fibrella musci TaxID=3242485 RepID=UPI003521DEFE
MIVTLTLNPAVDISLTTDRLVPEHKLHCSQPQYDAGGGGINVSKAIRRLGGQSLALFTVGGASGQTLEELVEAEGIHHQTIRLSGLTRECFVVTETTTNQQYRFGTPGPTLTPDEAADCLAHINRLEPPVDYIPVEYIVASGSLPPGLPTDFYAQLARKANAHNSRFVLDTAGEPLQAALDEGVFMIKPNLGELARLVNANWLETDQITEAATQLIRQKKCQIVVVSLGPRGAMLVDAAETIYVQAPPVKKLSTVGAGDSLVGGVVYALAQQRSYADAIQLGVACGTAATMNPGTELFHRVDTERLLTWIRQPYPVESV